MQMYLRNGILFTIVLCLALTARSQQFGGNPPSLKWRQINTDTARVIFPVGMEPQAQQVSSMVHALSRATLNTIGPQQRKINIVFQSQTTISNGYVGLAPFRSEFELTADQNSFELGSLPWQQQLVIHEYRHVEQYNNFRIGLSKAFYFLFGEGGQAFANSLSVPNWFFEGDAVYQETLVSRQGRGRLPWFFDGYRSLWAAGKNYSFMKLRNGSLRDYTPDHYPLGYMLVAYGREKYGDDFWRKTALDAARFKSLFYPLQTAVKKNAGICFNQFRADAFRHFGDEAGSGPAPDSAAAYAHQHRHFVADEEFPHFLDNDHVVYVRTTYKRVPAFVIRNTRTGKEKRISTKAISIDSYFSCKNGKVVYAAFEPDLRWTWRDYSVIRVLDLFNGSDKKITTRTKYFCPDISADGRRIIVVQQAANGEVSLRLLNAATGKVEKTIPNRDSLYFAQPKFFKNDQVAVCVRNRKGEMSLALVNIQNGNTLYLTPFSMNVIGFPSVQNDTIYFGASHAGQDLLFAWAAGKVYQVNLPFESTSTGNYELNSFAGHYAWNTFTAVGYKMFYAAPDRSCLHPMDANELEEALTTQGIHSLENGPADLLDKTPVRQFPVTRYSQSFHLINFNSWRPLITDPNYMLQLQSQNILNTLQSDIYIDYNRNEQYKQFGVDLTYAQLFPWIVGGANYTFDRNALYNGKTVYWNEAQALAGLSVPLNFTHGGHYTYLQFGDNMVYDQRYFQGSYKDTFSTKNYTYTAASLSFSNQIQQSVQQIYPRFAQSASLNYDRAVTSLRGDQLLATAYFYLPGVAHTNSLVIDGAFQQRDSLQEISFSNNFPFSRGYSAESFYRMFLVSGNYNVPLIYPDWGFADIVYFQRIRANLFYDCTLVPYFFTNGEGVQAQYRSFGTEIFFDTKWWNQLAISFGFRYSHLLDADYLGRGPNQWEFILPVNLLGQ